MIIIKIKGGLGNQMFQYAFGWILAKKYNEDLLLDTSVYGEKKINGIAKREFGLEIFNNDYLLASETDINSFLELSLIQQIRKKIGLNFRKIYNDRVFKYNPSALQLPPPIYLNGYFQSYRYFKGRESAVRNLFNFDIKNIDQSNLEFMQDMEHSSSVAIHVRRGDYVENEKTKSFHGGCSLEYYKRSISYIKDRIINPKLFFFSDDIEWVRKNFNVGLSSVFVEHNQGSDSWKDMLLISNCKHQIIANSSFSWWGAWLNDNPEKIVVAPARWLAKKEIDMNDLIPSTWVRL
ncbi:alpha-1,2-fucosyltransferase [Christiangramia sabulilitoris]|uniref:Alpha-1,2-fucosyltransferase n=1 Tax=Christiangramia sabulilitoris TaxID=2583991 RepID=A0A550HYV5_9FLAO|nr:alpha-1,2-fucosyltransferase [Christiangramia sabulilitoris]TRO63913.1 alpha-1,2-fucosyltransferase [Christiangramia sabulilitoris]